MEGNRLLGQANARSEEGLIESMAPFGCFGGPKKYISFNQQKSRRSTKVEQLGNFDFGQAYREFCNFAQ